MSNARYLLTAILASLFASFPLSVHAETVVQCGAMEGYAYIYPSPFVKQERQGFDENQVTKDSLSISVDNGQYDVNHLGESGEISSSIADGAKVIQIANTKDHFVLLVAYPDKTAEIYTYHKPSKTLTMLQHTYGALITSSRLMVSCCD